MTRELLEACWPAALVLLGCVCVFCILVRTAGACWDWSRFRAVHRCESGAVQSLAFVLTFPVLLAVLMLIVQVSQLMIAQMFVHYAAFAGARSASVWLPALTEMEAANQVAQMPNASANGGMLVEVAANTASDKLQKVRGAVIQACAPIAPSRDVGVVASSPQIAGIVADTNLIYANLAPATQNNPLIARRIANKLAYADANTQVFVEWIDGRSGAGQDSLSHRSYNPIGHPTVQFEPYEVGWQDPVTVYVVHRFALLPGPGRLLAKQIVRADGLPDRVSARIQPNPTATREALYSTVIQASATMTNEGIKSIRPYAQP